MTLVQIGICAASLSIFLGLIFITLVWGLPKYEMWRYYKEVEKRKKDRHLAEVQERLMDAQCIRRRVKAPWKEVPKSFGSHIESGGSYGGTD